MPVRMLDNNDCRVGRRQSFEAEEVSFEPARVAVVVQSQKFVGAGPHVCSNQGDHRGSPLH
jgi:hypothetical protein